MLRSLHVENIAVIKRLDVDFSRGFTALTGETGAGKSIIIDSINLLLGSKADRELIRTGESFAMVSGLFSDLSKSSVDVLSEVGVSLDEEGNILIQRTVSVDGKSQIKINGRAATLAHLRIIAPSLMSIHGQSDTQAITDAKKQLELIDLYAHSENLLEEYGNAYAVLESIRRQIEEIRVKETERERLCEILEYQIKDIDSLVLHSGEEEELIDKKLKIKNSEKITKNASFAFKALKGSEKGSISLLLDRSAQALSQISDVIPEFSEYSDVLKEMKYRIDDIAEEVYAATSDIDDDPTESLNKIESRLDKISKIKRKYGLTIDDVLLFRDKAAEELETLKNSEDVLKKLIEEEKEAYSVALSIAEKLHKIRESSSKEIEKSVKETLEFLDMPKVVFFASIKEEYKNGIKELYPDGSDRIEFYISANTGAEPQPLSKIASGGELARIMLALKSVIADRDGVSTVIFDEIDAGVSGKTARKIGIKMLSLAKKTQIFCVTHSAQIASLADTHLLIKKKTTDKKTETEIQTLSEEGRIDELSRILGGINVTDAQRRAASDMLSERISYL